MAATADEVAGGRLILGLAAAGTSPSTTAFGYPFDHRVGRFEEALRIIVPLVRGERVTFDGTWTGRGRRAAPAAAPAVVADPHRRQGRRMLRLTARHADAWNTAWYGLPTERFTPPPRRAPGGMRRGGPRPGDALS